MFKFPLAIIYAKPGFDQKDPELKHLQHDIDNWGSLSTKSKEATKLTPYLKETNKEDAKITSAINLMLNFERQAIIDAYTEADKYKSVACDLQLMTAHTSKGATRDIVELDNDLNEAIKDLVLKKPELYTDDERAELCLYFVAISRHKYVLLNAKHLNLENFDV